MGFPYGVTVTVERPGGTDQYGNPLPPADHTIDDCAVAQDSTLEMTDGRATTITVFSLYTTTPDADLEPQDVIVMPDGERWQVQGDAWSPVHPMTGWQPGTRVDVRKVEG